MNFKLNKKILVIVTGFCLMVACGVLYLEKNSQPEKNISNTHKILGDQISGLPNGTKVKSNYLYADNIIEDMKAEENGIVSSIIEQEITSQNKYSVHYNIQLSDLKYIDVEFNIDNTSNQFDALITGLNPKEKTSLIINKRHFYKEIPSDWSGKIELTASLKTSLEKQRICVRLGEAPKTICHLTPINVEEAI